MRARHALDRGYRRVNGGVASLQGLRGRPPGDATPQGSANEVDIITVLFMPVLLHAILAINGPCRGVVSCLVVNWHAGAMCGRFVSQLFVFAARACATLTNRGIFLATTPR